MALKNERAKMHSAVLVLNHNYEPLNITTVRRAIVLVFKGKADVVKSDSEPIRSATREFPLPLVVRLNHYAKRPPTQIRLNRKSVLARDNHTCQYCGYRGAGLTVDHVIPKDQGGHTEWENLVCCCIKCNVKKANRAPHEAGLTLRKKPRKPAYVPYMAYTKLMAALHNEKWREFFLPFVRE